MTDSDINYEQGWRDVAMFCFGVATGLVFSVIGFAILGATLG